MFASAFGDEVKKLMRLREANETISVEEVVLVELDHVKNSVNEKVKAY